MRSLSTICWLVLLSVSVLTCRVKQYPPELTAVSPKAASIGQDITLTGFQFGDEPNVSFGQNGTFVGGAIKNTTDQALTVTVPRMVVGPTQIRVINAEGTSDPVAFTILQPMPILTLVSPINGLPGTTVVVTGDYLDRLKIVRFGVIPVTQTASANPQSISVTIPANAQPGVQKLYLETDGGSTTIDFIVAGTPEITSFTPKRPRIGQELVIQGKYLANGIVRINGLPTDPAQTQARDTEIRTVVPAAATSGKITVTTFDKLVATSTDSVVLAFPPLIDANGLSLTEGIQGDKLTITGRNFRDVSDVKVGNTAATFRILSDTQLEVTIPALPQSGDQFITLSSIGGTTTSQQAFLAILPPANIVFSPARQIRGREMIISGQHLHRVTEVRINGRPATITSRVEGSEVRATVPADATSGPITVINRAGTNASNRNLIVVLAPTISSFTRKAEVGGRVTIQGTFLQDARVLFSGSTNAAANDGKNTDDEIWVKVPSDAQTGAIRIVNDAGEVTTPSAFTVLRAPSAITFTPTSGSIGSTITINGQNILDVTEIRFGGGKSLPAQFRGSGSSLIVTVPASATDGTICLTNEAGTTCSTALFTVVQPPSAVAFTPATGAALTSMTLTGQNLATASEVRFGGGKSSPAAFRVSGTSLIVTVPADATDGPICVTNNGGTACSTASFNVLLLPTVITFTPITAKAGTEITITGQNLSTVKTVKFSGGKSSAATFRLSGSSLIVTVPADAIDGPICLTSEGGTVCSGTDFKIL